jgi:hypothetical protein
LLESIVLHLVSEAKTLEEVEEKTAEALFEVGRAILKAYLEHLDEALMKKREKGLRHLGRRERDVLTRFGVVRVKRRYYRDGEGNTRFLPGEALGLRKGNLAATPSRKEAALRMCADTSFRRAAGHLSFFLSFKVDHNLLHRRVGERGRQRTEEKRKRAEELFSRGALPPSRKKEADLLFLEADGCMIPLQREGRKKHELKAGISYEGWERVSEGKWRTRKRRVFLSAAPGEDFLSQWSTDLATVYDHAKVKEVIWSSDGASWLRKGPELFSPHCAQLSRFHLKRSLVRALGFSPEAERLFALACRGRGEEVVSELQKQLQTATDEKGKKRIAETLSYLSSTLAWLCDWRKVLPPRDGDRSPGAMEGNVDKLLSDRFKKRGMSWSVSGADSLCQVIELSQNGELSSFLASRRATDRRAERMAMSSLRKEVRRNPEAWLKKNMPLLQTRSGDPWVKDVLKVLAGYERMAG